MYKAVLKHARKNDDTMSSPICNCMQRCFIQTKGKSEAKAKVSNLKKYWFMKYVNYIKNYEETLAKNFPRTVHIYRFFSTGTREFLADVKKYISVKKKATLYGSNNLNRQEIELIHYMPNDLKKMSPILLLSMLPFSNYVVFPLAYYFPQHLLTWHYWNVQQKEQFILSVHKNKVKHSRLLYECMQKEAHTISDITLKKRWEAIEACLGSGDHPTIENIIHCIPLFMKQQQFALENLTSRHMKQLLAIHGLSPWRPFRKKRLFERGLLLKQMDNAIVKEGGVQYISKNSLPWALSIRGLNPIDLSTECMRDWLTQWVLLSTSIKEDSISLLLHSPILLAYNHHSNLRVLYK